MGAVEQAIKTMRSTVCHTAAMAHLRRNTVLITPAEFKFTLFVALFFVSPSTNEANMWLFSGLMLHCVHQLLKYTVVASCLVLGR